MYHVGKGAQLPKFVASLLFLELRLFFHVPIPQEHWATELWRNACKEAQLYKEKGNQCYREGTYRDAVSGYHRALLQLRGLDPSLPSPIPNLGPQGPALTPEQENLLHTTQTDCYNNLAACLLQMEPVNYERVKEYSQKDLERQPDNAKALYRAGVAFFHLQDYDQARHYLMAAVNRKPKDANVRRYLQWTQLELSSYHRKEKQLYLGMFG
ncbi:hypothetical protein E5288_WYG007933 [Bos mutus]|uniref:Tetratricopeptide repeat protein 9C n=1 Tax=Bos mutus TaxID=72004 RepID=A0A6B0QZF9_9CETA|nr:hypothetical protein [Bos mutus]